MSGEYSQVDETITSAGVDYHFMLAHPTRASNVSASPFAPKSTTGDRSYADYDAISVMAQSDFSGGMGQERLTDTTMFYTSYNTDTRGGRIILGPKVTSTTPVFPHTFVPDYYFAIGTAVVYGENSPQKLAQKFSTPAGMTKWRCVWLYLLGDQGLGDVTVKVYDNNAGTPGSELATGTISAGTLRPQGQWVCVPFTSALTVTPVVTYWISVENSATSCVHWAYQSAIAGLSEVARYDSGWAAVETLRMVFFADDYEDRPDSPAVPFIGSGKDEIARVWLRAGRSLYYVNASGAPVAVEDGSSAVKTLGSDMVTHAWFRGPSDTHPYLYLGLGDSVAMEKFDGEIGAETWATQTGHYASALCVHDALLAFGYDRNLVDFYDGASTWGSTAAKIGDRTYQIRNMVSWNGDVWVGKDDGLYKVVVPTGYPATGALSSQKIIDLLSVADTDNFSFMVVHLGDLYFNIGNGVMRYTTGSVLQSIGPDVGLDISQSKRLTYRAAVSAINAIYILAEGTATSYYLGGHYNYWYITDLGINNLLVYTEGHWHSLAAFEGVESMLLRGICIEPGWYGNYPRLWFGDGMSLSYLEMPTGTYRRWTVPNVEYADVGYLLTSWFDGNIRTLNKDWIAVNVALNSTYSGTGAPTIEVYWRESESDTWEQVGATTPAIDSNVELAFPVNSYSVRCQLKVVLNGALSGDTDTPMIEALTIRYMERPDNILTFTRAYKLADRAENRNGIITTYSLAEQFANLHALRAAQEPLSLRTWYGTTYTVHIVDIATSEMPEEQRGTGDKGLMLAIVRFQQVA